MTVKNAALAAAAVLGLTLAAAVVVMLTILIEGFGVLLELVAESLEEQTP